MWEQRVFGSIWILVNVPWWLVIIGVAVFSIGMVVFLRWWVEHEVYDRALSSTPGDLFLAGYCGIAAYICQTQLPTGLHMWPLWHVICFTVLFFIAVMLHMRAIRQGGASRRFTMLPAQWYHNFVVVPVLSYIIVSTLPIICSKEQILLFLLAAGCLLAWARLLVSDMTHGRLIQKKY